MKKLLTVFLCFVLACQVVTVIATEELTCDVIVLEQKETDSVVLCNATIDDEFSDNIVIVTLKKECNNWTRKVTFEDFPNIDIKEIEYLTPLLEEVSEDSLIAIDDFRYIIKLVLRIPGKENVLNAIQSLQVNPIVKSAEPSFFYEVEESVPNDPQFLDGTQYALDKIDAEFAWNSTIGSSTVKVGVIDTGIASHPDLDANVVEGWDFYNENNVTNDDTKGHGTMVAGVIGAVGNNGIGITGIAQTVSLVPLQVWNSNANHLDTSSILEAISYCAMEGIPIVNMSINATYYGYNNAFDTALNSYTGLFCNSAGNNRYELGETTGIDIDDFANTGKYIYPGVRTNSNMIVVAATDNTDALSSYSYYGSISVDLAAPGTGIYTTAVNNAYTTSSGTSFASPYVAGTAALLLSKNPNLTAHQLKKAILDSVDLIPSLEGKTVTGGRLNTANALSLVTTGKAKEYKVVTYVNDMTDISYFSQGIRHNMYCMDYVDSFAGALVNGNIGRFCIVDRELSTYSFIDDENPLNGSLQLYTAIYNSPFFSVDGVNEFTVYEPIIEDINGNGISEPNYETYVVLLGDVNFDGMVTTLDQMNVNQAISGTMTFTTQQNLAADVNCDGYIDSTDVFLINQYIFGIIEVMYS